MHSSDQLDDRPLATDAFALEEEVQDDPGSLGAGLTAEGQLLWSSWSPCRDRYDRDGSCKDLRDTAH